MKDIIDLLKNTLPRPNIDPFAKSCWNCRGGYDEGFIGDGGDILVRKCHHGLNRLSDYNPCMDIRDVGHICKEFTLTQNKD